MTLNFFAPLENQTCDLLPRTQLSCHATYTAHLTLHEIPFFWINLWRTSFYKEPFRPLGFETGTNVHISLRSNTGWNKCRVSKILSVVVSIHDVWVWDKLHLISCTVLCYVRYLVISGLTCSLAIESGTNVLISSVSQRGRDKSQKSIWCYVVAGVSMLSNRAQN